MNNKIKAFVTSFISQLLIFTLLMSFLSFSYVSATAYARALTDISADAAVLMEGSTGTIIYEKDKDKELIPASITKIMTLILIFEAIDSGKLSLNDEVSVSEYAASMGGSQVFLEAGEKQSVDTMIKCISIASANDACVAMAEHIAGNEQTFVDMMNEKAASLNMKHTHFMNCNGLDDSIKSGHYTSALDVAIMSRELITQHPEIEKYSTVWMDTITHTNHKGVKSEFGLTNTNKLVRTYNGITGLKTGSTKKARYCLSATARRNNTDIIAVVMGAPDPKARFSLAASLLDYGFTNTEKYIDEYKDLALQPIPVKGSLTKEINIWPKESFKHIFKNGEDTSLIKRNVKLPESLNAPVKQGDIIGQIDYDYGGNIIGSISLIAKNEAPKSSFMDCFEAIICKYFKLWGL